MEREMASIIFSAKDIFEQEFGREVRGYSKAEVDEFLDDVIKDYGLTQLWSNLFVRRLLI